MAKKTVTVTKTAHSTTTKRPDGTKSVSHSISSHVDEQSVVHLGSLESPQPMQPSRPVVDDYEPGGNHYEMGDNGNYNSGPEACRRYPRMSEEIGGVENSDGRDRITLQHDAELIHKR